MPHRAYRAIGYNAPIAGRSFAEPGAEGATLIDLLDYAASAEEKVRLLIV